MATTVTAAHHFIWRHLYAGMQAAQTPASKFPQLIQWRRSRQRLHSEHNWIVTLICSAVQNKPKINLTPIRLFNPLQTNDPFHTNNFLLEMNNMPTPKKVCYCYSSSEVVRSNKKQTKNGLGKLFTGLSRHNSYKLEVSILQRLNSVESPCIHHWPVLINYNDLIHSFTTSWDGIPLSTVEGTKQFCKLSVDFLIDQGR